ncbi:MAG TPA: hypothetical protein VE662_06010 [Solirubrobacterales bacterium]|nr:hypothetical protein [Solirubrobacterales bacterium]
MQEVRGGGDVEAPGLEGKALPVPEKQLPFRRKRARSREHLRRGVEANCPLWPVTAPGELSEHGGRSRADVEKALALGDVQQVE